MRVCRNCKSQIDDDSLFCPECGIEIENNKYCIHCGKEIEEGSIYCPFCGASQEEIKDANVPEIPSSEKSNEANDLNQPSSNHKRVCPNCKAVLDDIAIFCPECGAKIEDVRCCIKCGKEIDEDCDFCPYCGTPQTEDDVIEDIKKEEELSHEEANKNISEVGTTALDTKNEPQIARRESKDEENNNIYRIACIAILFIIALGLSLFYFYLKNDSDSESSHTMLYSNSNENAIQGNEKYADPKEIRINEIFSKGLKMNYEDAVNTYYSQEFRRLYNEIEKIDATGIEIGFWEGSLWDGNQDIDANKIEIKRIDNVNSESFNADICLIRDYDFSDYSEVLTFRFILENGIWYIDDNLSRSLKKYMKEYIEFESEEPISLKDCPNEGLGLEVNLSIGEDEAQIIEIFKDGKFIQRMEGISGEFASDVSNSFEHNDNSIIHFIDANFDGEIDIFIGSGRDRTINSLLIWNPEEDLFKRVIENITNPLFFPQRKSIMESRSLNAFYGGYSEYYWDGKKYENYGLELIEVNNINNFDYIIYEGSKLTKKYTLIESGAILKESNEGSDLPYRWQIALAKYRQLFGRE